MSKVHVMDPLGRVITVLSLDSSDFPAAETPFCALLNVLDVTDSDLAFERACSLAEIGCVDICITGPHSEAIHDRLDSYLETRDLLDTVTTWDDDLRSGLEYFIFGTDPKFVHRFVFAKDIEDAVEAIASMGQDNPPHGQERLRQ